MTDLYVMQNECGLIKIGRSLDVEKRRKALEGTEGCRIAVVAVVQGAGHLEEQTHIALNEFRIIGEWFDGTDAARSAVERQIGSGLISSWPFGLAEQATVEDWLEKVEGRRFLQSSNREFSRLISHMKSILPERRESSRGYFDVHIWMMLSSFGSNRDGRIVSDRGRDGDTELRIVGGANSGELVPAYTQEIAAALLVWPETMRPLTWSAGAWECCIEGLAARKADNALIIRALLDSEDTDF